MSWSAGWARTASWPVPFPGTVPSHLRVQWLDKFHGQVLIQTMETHNVAGPKGPSRRAFLSASAVTAAAVPLVTVIAPASAASADVGPAKNTGNFDPDLRALIRQIDPSRIQATIEQLVQFGTRHTASSQTDPVPAA